MRSKRLLVAAVLGGIVAAAGCETCQSCKKGSADPVLTGGGANPPAGGSAGLYGPPATTGAMTTPPAGTPAAGMPAAGLTAPGLSKPTGGFGGAGQ